MHEQGYLLYVWTANGYALEQHEGEPPAVGSKLTIDGTELLVSKVASSPLPGDPRPCAYLQPA